MPCYVGHACLRGSARADLCAIRCRAIVILRAALVEPRNGVALDAARPDLARADGHMLAREQVRRAGEQAHVAHVLEQRQGLVVHADELLLVADALATESVLDGQVKVEPLVQHGDEPLQHQDDHVRARAAGRDVHGLAEPLRECQQGTAPRQDLLHRKLLELPRNDQVEAVLG